MTLREVSTQLHNLSVNGVFNGQKFSITELEKFIYNMFRTPLKGGNRLVMNITLPDGNWYFFITKFEKNQFDYTIPETRNQEKRVIALLN